MTLVNLIEEFAREQGFTESQIRDATAFARSGCPGRGDREIPEEELPQMRAMLAITFAVGYLKMRLGIDQVQEIVERN